MYEPDLVYFNAKVSPANTDWIRCKVKSYTALGVTVAVTDAYGRTGEKNYFFPAHNIQRIEREAR